MKAKLANLIAKMNMTKASVGFTIGGGILGLIGSVAGIFAMNQTAADTAIKTVSNLIEVEEEINE